MSSRKKNCLHHVIVVIGFSDQSQQPEGTENGSAYQHYQAEWPPNDALSIAIYKLFINAIG